MARITAVYDNLELTVQEAKDYARIDNDDEDALIALLIDAGKEAADEYLGNKFQTGGVDDPIPAAVKLWVMQFVVLNYERRSLQLSDQRTVSVGAQKWDLASPETDLIFKYRKIPLSY